MALVRPIAVETEIFALCPVCEANRSRLFSSGESG